MENRIELKNKNNHKIVGVLHQFSDTTVVIVCTGYLAHKDQPIIKKALQLLDPSGPSILRFDFSGHGESEGKGRYLPVFKQRLEDIGLFIKILKEQYKYKHIILEGISMDAAVVVMAAEIYPQIDALITYAGMFDWKEKKVIYFIFKHFPVLNRYYKVNLEWYKKYYKPETLTLPVLVIHGENDRLVNKRQSLTFYNQLKTDKTLVYVKAGHFLWRSEELKPLFKIVNDWIKEKGF